MSGIDRMREICRRNAEGPMHREGRVVTHRQDQGTLPGIALKPDLHIELWIAQRIGQPDLLTGVTTAEQRRERIREALLPISDHIAGKEKSGQAQTWEQLYRRVYGRSLQTETQRGSA